MLDENNLNLISRMELLDTLKVVPSGTVAAKQITGLLNSEPQDRGEHSQDDVFDIQFEREVLEVIAYAVEQYAYDHAEPYVVALEEGNDKPEDARSFQYWQVLSERWSYLELMR